METKHPVDEHRILEVAAVILAGGFSRRMGTDKANLVFEGRTLLQRQIDRMSEIFESVFVACGDPARYPSLPVKTVADLIPGGGALSGIHAGLRESGKQAVFVIACDAPFPNAGLIRYLVSLSDSADWILPRTQKWIEPLFSVYGRACFAVIERMLRAKKYQIFELTELVRPLYVEEDMVRRYDPELLSFANWNTPQEVLGDSE